MHGSHYGYSQRGFSSRTVKVTVTDVQIECKYMCVLWSALLEEM